MLEQTSADSKAESSKNVPPAISHLKCRGTICSMGEKCATNRVTDTESASVPIAASPGRSGFGPQLSDLYDSGSGKGPFDWILSLPAITRKTDKVYCTISMRKESDLFLLFGVEELVSEFNKDNHGHCIDLGRFRLGGRSDAAVGCISRA